MDASKNNAHQVAEKGDKGYETRDANPNTLFLIGGGLIVLILVVMFVVLGVLKILDLHKPVLNEAPPPVTAEAHVVPPEPRLQANPEADYARLLVEQNSLLQTYAWVDRRLGLARIPIDTAIAIVAARNLPFQERTSGVAEGYAGEGRNQ
jgi:hypothetical protein